MAKMTFKRDWDFNHGNRPVFLNDMTQDEQVRQILQDAIGIAGRGEDGEDGEDGRGIVSLEKTAGDSTPGTFDTWTFTYTDATTSSFMVYHGLNGEGAQSANEVPYANTTSGLEATDVQAAIDEVVEMTDSIAPGVLLLEAGEDETDVPPETPVGTVVFRKAGA